MTCHNTHACSSCIHTETDRQNGEERKTDRMADIHTDREKDQWLKTD